MRSGFAAITGAKKEFEAQQSEWASQRVRDMRLINDGDEADIWFIGCEPDEPREALTHTATPKPKKFDYPICGREDPDAPGCVDCVEVKAGNKKVKKASKNFYFSVADTRWVHKQPNEKLSKQYNREVFDWEDCPKTDDNPKAPCKLCKRKVPRERGGRKKLRAGLQTAIVISGLNDSLKRRCQKCNGKITISEYTNGKGKTRDDLDDLDEDQLKKWSPVYECSKCDDPTPGNIFSAPIRMKRNGTGQNTTYTFTREEDFQDQPEWVQELEPLDWDKILKPQSAERRAESLDVPNPFDPSTKKRKNGEAEDYDDDEDDEDAASPFGDDDDDDEDDEDDDKPKSKKKGKSKRRDEDEEDDEDDDDDD